MQGPKDSISRIAFLQNINKSRISYDLPQEIGYYSQSVLNGQVMDRSMLRIYDPVSRPTSLTSGQKLATLKQEEKAEYLEPLLYAMEYWASKSTSVSQMIQQANVITWRGLIGKLAMTCYLNEAISLRVCLFNQCLYIMEHKSTIVRSSLPDAVQKGMYIGHKFEAIMTLNSKGQRDENSIVNEKEYYISIVKAKLNGCRILFGAEVDCYDPSVFHNPTASMDQYMELKTTIDRNNERNGMNISEDKLFKYWIQSYLAGVPRIVVGYRNSNGMLNRTQVLLTKDLVRKTSWDSDTCLLWVYNILEWIRFYTNSYSHSSNLMEEYIVSFDSPFETIYIERKSCNEHEDNHLNKPMLPESWITFIQNSSLK